MNLFQDLPDARDYTAAIARGNNEKARAEAAAITDKIKKAVTKGDSSVSVTSLSSSVKAALEQKGYKVNFYEGDCRDPRETDYYTISW